MSKKELAKFACETFLEKFRLIAVTVFESGCKQITKTAAEINFASDKMHLGTVRGPTVASRFKLFPARNWGVVFFLAKNLTLLGTFFRLKTFSL
jgi:hypothetical protein